MGFKAMCTKKVSQEVTMGREDPDPGLLSPSALTCSLGRCGAGLPSVPEGSGGAGPGGPHILRRAAKWPWYPGRAALNPLFFLGCSQAPAGPQGIWTGQRPPPGAEAMGPLAVGGQAQVAIHILRNDGDALAQVPGPRVTAGRGLLGQRVLHAHRAVLGVAAAAPAATGHLLLFIEAAGQALVLHAVRPGQMVRVKAIEALGAGGLWLPAWGAAPLTGRGAQVQGATPGRPRAGVWGGGRGLAAAGARRPLPGPLPGPEVRGGARRGLEPPL